MPIKHVQFSTQTKHTYRSILDLLLEVIYEKVWLSLSLCANALVQYTRTFQLHFQFIFKIDTKAKPCLCTYTTECNFGLTYIT